MRPRNFLEETFSHKFMGVAGCVRVLHGQANDQIIPGGEGGWRWGGSLTNVFTSHLNNANLEIFPNHGGIYTCTLEVKS